MKGAWVVAVLAIGMMGCEGALDASAGDSPIVIDTNTGANGGGGGVTQPSASGLTGEELYVRNCAGCHGIGAVGTPTFEGSIAGYPDIHDIVVNGVGAMVRVPMADGDIALVQEYLLSLGFPDWSALSGEEIYEVECARCHGASADGTGDGPQLVFRDDEFFDYAARRGGMADRFTNSMPAYGTDRITDAQMAELITFVNSHENATSGQGLLHQFCANCHGDSTISGRVEGLGDDSISGVVRSGKGDGVQDRDYMSRWSVTELSDAEVALIQSYINANL